MFVKNTRMFFARLSLAGRMSAVVGAAAALIILAGALYYRSAGFVPFSLGVLLGAAGNVLRIFLLDRAVGQSVRMDRKKGVHYIRFQYLLRLLVSAAALGIAVAVPFINVYGAVAGILTMQIATFSIHFLSKR
jgi:hypothetical protein